MTTWVRDETSTTHLVLEHLGGVSWWRAPRPFWLHRCRAQTRGWVVYDRYERCACGATRTRAYARPGPVPWVGKNSRRKGADDRT